MKKTIVSVVVGFVVAFTVGFTSGSAEASSTVPTTQVGEPECLTNADCAAKCPPPAEGGICSPRKICFCVH